MLALCGGCTDMAPNPATVELVRLKHGRDEQEGVVRTSSVDTYLWMHNRGSHAQKVRPTHTPRGDGRLPWPSAWHPRP